VFGCAEAEGGTSNGAHAVTGIELPASSDKMNWGLEK
jgi:hypothetical protein